MTTARNILTAALEDLGAVSVGQLMNPDDASVCLRALNVLVDAWNVQPGLMFTSALETFALPAATTSRTIGPGMQIDCVRPVRIESRGNFITVGALDYPLEIIGEAEYNEIALKTVSGAWPSVAMYDTDSPTGTVKFWPTGACTVTLRLLQPLESFATLDTAVILPPGYEAAFQYGLEMAVAGKFGVTMTPLQLRLADNAIRTVKRANFTVPTLRMGDPSAGDPGWIRIKGG